jgi:hypothetical protein
MKAGYFIIIGLIIWLAFDLSNSIWVYQTNAQIYAAIIIGLSAIVWLTSKNNRRRLWNTYRFKWPENLLEYLTDKIQVGLIAIFSTIALISVIGKEIVRHSDGYKFIKNEVIQDKSVIDKVGEIKYIALENFSAGLKFKNSQKQLSVKLKIFGSNGTINAEVKATKFYIWYLKEINFH